MVCSITNDYNYTDHLTKVVIYNLYKMISDSNYIKITCYIIFSSIK